MNTIIFLGGVPGSGKTTLAYHLASIYKIDKVISLDVLKNILKTYIPLDEKYVHTTTHEAYKIENLEKIDGFIKHTRVINSYFQDLIKTFTKEKVIIVEGATVTNEMLNYFKKSNLIYINLHVEKKELLLDRYKQKAKMRKGKWIENIETIFEMNEYLKYQSLINIEVNNNIEKTLKEIRKYINESIFL